MSGGRVTRVGDGWWLPEAYLWRLMPLAVERFESLKARGLLSDRFQADTELLRRAVTDYTRQREANLTPDLTTSHGDSTAVQEESTMDTEQAARLLGISSHGVAALCRRGSLDARRVRGSWRLDESVVRAELARRAGRNAA